MAIRAEAAPFLPSVGYGFVEVGPQELPKERRKKWESSARNSKILRKAIAGREPRLE